MRYKLKCNIHLTNSVPCDCDIPLYSRLIGLSESVMLKISKARTISNIQYLNLHGNGLTKVKEVQALPRLKRLVLSFNELTRLDELAHMVRNLSLHRRIKQLDRLYKVIYG